MLKNIQVRTLLLLLFTTIVSVNGRQTSRFGRTVYSPDSKLDVKENVHVLKKDVPMYHATAAAFSEFAETATWFSPDFLEGFKLVATGTSKTESPDIYIKECHVKEDTNLFAMKPFEAASRVELEKLGVPGKLIPDIWYGKTAKQTAAFVDAFCATLPGKGIFGWRNWWDQDEIMICPPIAPKIVCSGGYFCKGSVLSNLVGFLPADKKPFVFVGKDEEVKGKSHRVTFFIVDALKYELSLKWTFDQAAKEDRADVVFKQACAKTNDLEKFVKEHMERKKIQELQALSQPPPLPRYAKPIKDYIVQQYQQRHTVTPGSPPLKWDAIELAYQNQQINLDQLNTWAEERRKMPG